MKWFQSCFMTVILSFFLLSSVNANDVDDIKNLNRNKCGLIRVFEGTVVGLGVRATGWQAFGNRQPYKSCRFGTVHGFGAEIRSNFKWGSKKISETSKTYLISRGHSIRRAVKSVCCPQS